jgi:hypothetical protein
MPNTNRYKTPKRKPCNKAKNGTGKKRGGWPFSNTQSDIDKAILKYKNQIIQLDQAKTVLETKIAKLETAQKTDKSIKEETEKLNQLNKEKKDALVSATSGEDWFSAIAKFFGQQAKEVKQSEAKQ